MTKEPLGQTSVRVVAQRHERGNSVQFALLGVFEDLLVPGLDLLEPGHRAARLLGDPAGERLRPLFLRDVALCDVTVEVGWGLQVGIVFSSGWSGARLSPMFDPWLSPYARVAF
jgi:hypothetical protein